MKFRGKVCPQPRVAHSQAAIGSDLYIFGGRQGLGMGDKDMDDLWRFNVNHKSWFQIRFKGESPCARSFHKMTSAGGKLYVFGGCGDFGNSSRMNDLYCFDPKTEKWTKLPSSDSIKGRGGAVF